MSNKNNNNIESFEGEIWKSIDDKGVYEASNFGRVKSLDRYKGNYFNKSKILNGYINKDGYNIICLYRKNVNISNIIVKVFLPNTENKKYLKHKDGDKCNNNINNLEWTNEYYKYSKSENERRLAVDEYFKEGKSCQEISIKYNVNRKTVGNWIKEFNKKARPNSGWRDLDKIDIVVKEYINGGRTGELSKKHNVCERTISSWIKEKGVLPIPYSVKMGYSDELNNKIINLYDNNMTCYQIAELLNLKNYYVYTVVTKYCRKNGNYNTVKLKGGRGGYMGHKGRVETRFGHIRFDSHYERDRIIQNSRNNNVKNMQRCNLKISYIDNNLKKREYRPDFLIENIDNSIIIEEVKPIFMMKDIKTKLKHKSAIKYCKKNNFKFRVVTENEIYEK